MATSDSGPCCLGDIIEGENKGKEIQVESFQSYLTLPEKNERKVGIIVITDIFGFQLPNTRKVGDLLANNGYAALIPDLFDGDIWLETSDWSKFGEWRVKHPQVASYDRILHCVEYLKQHHGVQKLGVIGFCWGGGAVQGLVSNFNVFSAGVAFYGIAEQKEGYKNVFEPQAPILFIFGGADQAIPKERIDALENGLKEHAKVPFNVKVYPGQPHGFAHRKKAQNFGDGDDLAQQGALNDMLDWLKTHITL